MSLIFAKTRAEVGDSPASELLNNLGARRRMGPTSGTIWNRVEPPKFATTAVAVKLRISLTAKPSDCPYGAEPPSQTGGLKLVGNGLSVPISALGILVAK